MPFLQHGIASQSTSLAKYVLTLSSLGIFAKLLNIDLSKLQILGVSVGGSGTELIPGFIGLALIYALLAFLVARMEATVDRALDQETLVTAKKVFDSKLLTTFSILSAPFSVVVYAVPYLLGILGVVLLWSDSLKVVYLIWKVLTR